MRHIRILGLLALFGLLLLPGAAQAWWNGDWPYRMRIVVGAEDNAPSRPAGRQLVLVRLHGGVFNFNNAKEDGTDLRFVAGDDRTPLRFYVERFDSLLEQVGLFWVSVPELSVGGQGTPIYVYWGNRNAPPAGSARETLDQETVLALNFGEEGGQLRDATGHGNNPAPGAGGRREDGLVAFGQALSGRDVITLNDAPTLGWRAGETLTWSMWVRPDADATTGVLYQARLEGGGTLTLGLAAGQPYAELAAAGVEPVRIAGTTALAAESWRQVALVAVGGQLRLFLDGRAQGEAAAALPAGNGAATLGGPLPEAAEPAPGFTGRIDVVRIAKADRSGLPLELAVRSEGSRGDFLRFDVAEEGSIWGTGPFAVIMRNLTIDAWIVMGICAVIGPITWIIFARKAMYISATAKANRNFRRAYRDAMAQAGTGGIAAVEGLDGPEALRRHRKSSLYRLWRTGIEEMDTRGGLARAGHLSDASLAAIRASVDREITMEGQRLNSGVVMLTIAISGGPFIGLLGTVVGVMVVFGAVAAAGDVNVNAIAPGIAAALAATVAGLAVAIPALFAYNYLLTRVRDLNADMRIFADELVTRLGEGAIAAFAPPDAPPAPLRAAAE
jgi:biopolymer transport protein ExbB